MSSLVRPIKGQTGVILVTTLLLLILLTGVALTSLASLGVNLSQSQNLVSTKQAFQLAEAGVQYAEKYLNQHQTLWSTYASPTPQTLIPSTTLTGLGTFTVSVQDGGNSSLQVTSTGTASNNAQAVTTAPTNKKKTKKATTVSPTTPAVWTVSCPSTINSTLYFQTDVSIPTSLGTTQTPWVTTLIAEGSIDLTAQSVVARAPNSADGALFKAGTQNFLFISNEDFHIGSLSGGILTGAVAAYGQVGIEGNPTMYGYVVAQDGSNLSGLVTANSLSGGAHLTWNSCLS